MQRRAVRPLAPAARAKAVQQVAVQPLTLKDAVAINLRRVNAITGKDGTTARAMRELFRRALDDLQKRMLGLRKVSGGEMAFSTANAKAVEAQIRASIETLTDQIEGYRIAGIRQTAMVGLADLSRTVRGLEKHYTGLTIPLRIDEAARFGGLVDGVSKSVMRRHPESSVRAYGENLIGKWEEHLSSAALGQTPYFEVVERVLAAAQTPGLLTGDNYGAPTFERWRAERIVRTEFMEALNGAKLAGMADIQANEMPDLRKMAIAHFDDRTSWDSFTMHGQVRRIDEEFEDGAGRRGQGPPLRPNDRETIVPHRKAWMVDDEDDNLDEVTEADLDLPGGREAVKRGATGAAATGG